MEIKVHIAFAADQLCLLQVGSAGAVAVGGLNWPATVVLSEIKVDIKMAIVVTNQGNRLESAPIKRKRRMRTKTFRASLRCFRDHAMADYGKTDRKASEIK